MKRRKFMKFFEMFKNSAKELKSTQCIVVTGMLIALYVVLGILGNVNITAALRINFTFLALAAIGMLYGPVVAVVAAIPCDLLTVFLRGSGAPLPQFTLILAFNALIYGIFLYGFKPEKSFRVNAKLFIAHAIVVVFGRIIFNTLALYHYGIGVAEGEALLAFAVPRITANLIQYPINIVMLYAILIPIKSAFPKAMGRSS
jgi:ECF transporter S component (folate family)